MYDFELEAADCRQSSTQLIKNEVNGKMIHVVTNYALMYEPPWSENQNENNFHRLQERQNEIEETLQRNLNHPSTGSVHVLVNQEKAEGRLNELDLCNKGKLQVHRVQTMPNFKDFFLYTRNNLLNKIVAITNMDIYLGEGFERLNKTLFLKYNVTYALTRHGRHEKRCNMFGKPRYCGTGKTVSQDTYVLMITAEDLTTEVLAEMDYPINFMESEYRLIWIFKNMMNRKPINPCNLLKTYHNHCVDIHGKYRPSIDRLQKRILRVAPTDRLIP